MNKIIPILPFLLIVAIRFHAQTATPEIVTITLNEGSLATAPLLIYS